MNLLITGASRGLGQEWILQALKRPEIKKIFAVSRNEKEILSWLPKDEAARVKILPISVGDDACGSKLKEAVDNEPIDILINNAGVYERGDDDFDKLNFDILRHTLEVNTMAAMRVTQALLSNLEKSKHPKVVHITSLMGSIADNGSGGAYSYRMSKAALNMFNKSFSIDYPSISSIVVHPGWVKTAMGGSGAPTTVTQSVSGMWKLVDKLNSKTTGKFFDFEGDELPW